MPNLDGESYRDVTLSFFVLSFVSSLLFSSCLVLSCLVLCVVYVQCFLFCDVLLWLFSFFSLFSTAFLCFLLFSPWLCFFFFAVFSSAFFALCSLRCSVSSLLRFPVFLLSFFLFLSFQPCCGSLLAACLACFCLSVSCFLLLVCLPDSFYYVIGFISDLLMLIYILFMFV